MLRASRGIRYDRLYVGTHDCPGSGFLRRLPELIRGTLTVSDAFAQPVHCYINADLVAVSEAIDDGIWRMSIRNGQ